MKKLILTLCLALSLTACGKKTDTPKTDKPVVKIGAILPLSGDLAVWGNSEKQGLLLAQEDLPHSTKYSYQLIFDDI